MASIEKQIKKLVQNADDDEEELADELKTLIEDFDEADLEDFCELLAGKLLAPANDNEED
ncbi:hypothetical protein [Phyllobacterium sp. P5_D12]